MKILRSNPEKISKRIRKRVRKLPTVALFEYVEEAGTGMVTGFEDFRREEDPASLIEIQTALTTLMIITEELLLRHKVQVEIDNDE